jgi:hypothetical protein
MKCPLGVFQAAARTHAHLDCIKDDCGFWVSDMDWSEDPPEDRGCCALVEIARSLRSVNVRIYGQES